MSDANHGPKKSGGKGKLMFIVVALASIGGGAAMPMLMAKSKTEDSEHSDKKSAKKAAAHGPSCNVPFGDVVVNLADDRMSRYLRLKIILKVEGVADEKVGTEHLATFKPVMKNWLIGHLAGKSLKEISGTMGVKKLQREILEKFEEIMAAEQEGHGHGSKVHMHLKEILFEDYVVQ